MHLIYFLNGHECDSPPQPVLIVSGGIIQPSGKSVFFVCLFVCFLFFVFLPAVFLINEI